MCAKHSRQYAKRSSRRLYQNMDRCLNRIKGLHEMFDDGQHEQHAELLGLIGQAQIHVQQFLVEFYIHAWGEEPSDWYADIGH